MLIFLSNSFWLIALTTNTCAFIRTNPTIRRCLIATLRKERWTAQLPRLLSSLTSILSESDLWPCCVNGSKNCTLLIFLVSDFFSHDEKTSQNYWNTKDYWCKYVRWPLFDKLWIRSISLSFFFPDLLLDCVSMWMCVWERESVSVSEFSWREGQTEKEKKMLAQEDCLFMWLFI